MIRRAALAIATLGLIACSSVAHQATAPEPAVHHHHDRPLVRRFEDAEHCARAWEGPERDASQRPADVIAAMRIDRGMTLVDLGVGTGYFLPYLSGAAGPDGHVLALDIEPVMIDFVTKRLQHDNLGNVEPRLVAGDDPGLAAGSVDRILIVNTWHHIPARAAYAAKLKSALRDGGAVFIVDFTLETDRGPAVEHRLPPEQVKRELTSGGLRAQILAEPLPDQYIVVGAR